MAALPRHFNTGRNRFGTLQPIQGQGHPLRSEILANFAEICGMPKNWSMQNFISLAKEQIRQEVASRKVLMFLSGGVDSSVAFALLNEALERISLDSSWQRLHAPRRIRADHAALPGSGLYERQAGISAKTSLRPWQDSPIPNRKGIRWARYSSGCAKGFSKNFNWTWRVDAWAGDALSDIIESGKRTRECHQISPQPGGWGDGTARSRSTGRTAEDLYKDEVRELEACSLPGFDRWRHPFRVLDYPWMFSVRKAGMTWEPTAGWNNGSSRPFRKIAAAPQSFRSVGGRPGRSAYLYPTRRALENPEDWNWLEEQSIRITNSVREINRGVPPQPCSTNPLKIRKPTAPGKDLTCSARRMPLQPKPWWNTIWCGTFSNCWWSCCRFQKTERGHSIVLNRSVPKMWWPLNLPGWLGSLNSLKQSLSNLPGIDAVFYDITHKPPATFGWEWHKILILKIN